MCRFLALLLCVIAIAIHVNGKSIKYQENSDVSSDTFKNTGADVKVYEYFDEGGLTQGTHHLEKIYEFPQIELIDKDNTKLMEIHRVGVLDKQIKSVQQRDRGFGKRHITYGFKKLTEQLPREVVIREIKRAFDVWAHTGILRFTELQDADFADISISFEKGKHTGDRYAFDGKGNALAHAFEGVPSTDRTSGDIHFDDDETWIVQTAIEPEGALGIDVYSVALHEIGHCLLGVNHTNVWESVMHGAYKYLDRNFRLHADDIRVMNEVYNEGIPPLPPVEPEEPAEPEEGLC